MDNRVHVKIAEGLQRLSTRDQRRIVDFLLRRVSSHPNPRALAKRLTAAEELWRFRVGDYRIITRFDNTRLTVLVIEIGNRREIYR